MRRLMTLFTILVLAISMLGQTQGPRGYTGARGPIGPAGPAGTQGTQGIQGIPGEVQHTLSYTWTADQTFRNLYAATHNTYDLGTTTTRWRTGYFGTSIYAPAICIVADCRSVWPAGGDVFLANANSFSNNNTFQHLYTAVNNSYDLGAAGVSWRNLYLAGKLYYGGSQYLWLNGSNLTFTNSAVTSPQLIVVGSDRSFAIAASALANGGIALGGTQSDFNSSTNSGYALKFLNAAGTTTYGTMTVSSANTLTLGTLHLLFSADNTYDIGATAATRPRTGYFGTSVITPTLCLAADCRSVWPSATGSFPLLATDGSVAAPSYSFSSETGLGFYRSAASKMTLTLGADIGTFLIRSGTNAAGVTIYNNAAGLGNGSWGLTGINYYYGPSTGDMGLVAYNNLIFYSGGSHRWDLNSSGHFIANTDNVYDIGASGANRPRSVYVGTNLYLGTEVLGQTSLATTKTSECQIDMTGSGAAGALTTSDTVPFACINSLGASVTITDVKCVVNAGTPTTFMLTRNDSTNILSSNCTCGVGVLSSSCALNGTPTLADGQWLNETLGTISPSTTNFHIAVRIKK